MTWAGERREQPRSFQSPGVFFLLTLPFIERAYRRCGFPAVDGATNSGTKIFVTWTKLRYITSSMNRRNFLELAAAGAGVLPISCLARTRVRQQQAVTVGPIAPERLGRTLIHEHIMVDFIGADATGPGRYDPEEVFLKALPHLRQVKSAGCDTLVDCTPAYIGRDAGLLRRLSQASGLQLVTNTGLYGAAQNKYVPRFAYAETAQQLAARWVKEFEDGIPPSGVRPGICSGSPSWGRCRIESDAGPC
jgi:hypothetical protein